MQKLVPLMAKISHSMGDLKVDQLTVLGKGGGSDDGDLAGKLITYGEQIKAATGIDVPALLRQKLGS
jgi:flotillin